MKLFGTVGKTLSVVACVAIMAGCSSSSKDGGAAGGDVTQSGVFIDSVVQGLAYDCQPSGLAGTTDAEGKYDYKAGDECSFAIPSTPSDILLGKTAATGVITPLAFLTGSDEDKLVNMLLLLQSLDSDANLDNGIQIPDNVQGYVDESLVANVEDWIAALDKFLWLGNGIQRSIDPNNALGHFYDAMNAYFQTPLTEAMFNDQQITFENGVVILKADKSYEMALYGDAEPCFGTWSIDTTVLTLAQTTCGLSLLSQSSKVDTAVIDFDTVPAAGAHFRAKVGSGPYDYAFETVNSAEVMSTPAAPSNLRGGYTATADSISVRWDDNSNNETSFQVLYNTTGDFSGTNSYKYVRGSGNSTGNMTLSGLPEGTTYYFKVRSWNTLGDSATTETYSAATLQTIPAAPSGLAFDIKNLVGTYGLHWIDNSDNETRFILETSDSVKFTSLVATRFGANATNTGSISNPSSGTTLYFRVKAINSAGSSAYSNVVSGTF